MALDIATRKKREKRVTIDCGDGESFVVILKPGRYSWNETMAWQDKLRSGANGHGTTNGNGAQGEDAALTTEQAGVLLEWASGVIGGFEGLTNSGEPVTTDQLGELEPEILGFIFNAVTESLSGGKQSVSS